MTITYQNETYDITDCWQNGDTCYTTAEMEDDECMMWYVIRVITQDDFGTVAFYQTMSEPSRADAEMIHLSHLIEEMNDLRELN